MSELKVIRSQIRTPERTGVILQFRGALGWVKWEGQSSAELVNLANGTSATLDEIKANRLKPLNTFSQRNDLL